MASTSFNLSTSSYQGRYLKLTCSQIKNISGNKSTIKWTLSSVGGTSNYYSTGATTVKINGEQVYYLERKNWDSYSFPAKKGSVSGSIEVAHTSDGSKTITCSIKTAIHTSTLSTVSDSWELESIPRQATISSAPNFNDEQNPTITYSNLAGNNVDSLQACISWTGGADISYRDISKTGTSYTFNLTETERNALRNSCINSKTKTLTFIIRTTIGGINYFSSLTKTLTIVNANPTFTTSNVSYLDTNSSIVAITTNNQNIVQNKSTLKVNYTAATGLKGATITSYSFILNSVTKTSTTAGGSVSFGTINSANDLTLSAIVTDSRGNTTTITKTITMLAWSLPTAIISIERVNNYEDTTKLKVDGSISSVDGKNTMLIQYRYKQTGGSYNSYTTISDNTEYTLTLDKNNSYEFDIKITDSFGYKNFTPPTLSKGRFPLFIDTEMNAVGINEFPSEGEALRVAGGYGNFENVKIDGRGILKLGATGDDSRLWVKSSKNLLNINTKRNGHINGNWGFIEDNTSWDYVEIHNDFSNKSYAFSMNCTGTTSYEVCYYASDGSYLGFVWGDFTSTDNSKVAITPNNTAFIRIAWTNSTGASDIQFELGTSATTYESYIEPNILVNHGGGYQELNCGVSSGSNANGNYIKFADGTLICTIRLNVTDQAINTGYGSLFLGIRNWIYPATFIEAPTVTCSEFQWGTSASWGLVGNVYTGQCVLRGLDVVSRTTGTSCKISAIAIGKWK